MRHLLQNGTMWSVLGVGLLWMGWAAPASQAAGIASDAFETTPAGTGGTYVSGVLVNQNATTGVSGLSGIWVNSNSTYTGDLRVEEGSLWHDLVTGTTGDGKLWTTTGPAWRGLFRPLSSPPVGGTFYFSFVMEAEGDKVSGLGLRTHGPSYAEIDDPSIGGISVGFNGSDIAVWVNGQATTILTNFNLDESYFVLVTVVDDGTTGDDGILVDVFDSTNIDLDNPTATAIITTEDITGTLQYLAAMKGGSQSNVTFYDEFRLGTALEDVVFVPTGPTADGVTGDIGVPDATLTITPLPGEAFGATGPTVVFYEDFRGSVTVGTQVPTTSPLIGQWTTTGTYYPILYDADDLIGGNSMRGYHEASKRAAIGKISFDPTDRVFVSYWWKVPAGKRFPGATAENVYPGGSHWKPAWIARGEGRGGNDGPDLVIPTWNSRWSIVGNDGYRMMNKVLFTGVATSPDNKWNRFVNYLNEGGVSYFQAIIKGESNTFITHNVPVFTGTAGASLTPHHWDNINLIGWARTGTDNCQTLVDAIYVASGDHPAARVEIGNAEIYSDATELYLLTIDSWNNGQITGKQRIPAGLNVDGWYIHVHIGDNVHENAGVGRLITD